MLERARILIARNGGKSIVGRDWLSAMKYKISAPISEKGEWIVNTIKVNQASSVEKLSCETMAFLKEFPELFTRKGKVKDYEVKIQMKDEAKVSQQKGRRIPIQLQNAVDD